MVQWVDHEQRIPFFADHSGSGLKYIFFNSGTTQSGLIHLYQQFATMIRCELLRCATILYSVLHYFWGIITDFSANIQILKDDLYRDPLRYYLTPLWEPRENGRSAQLSLSSPCLRDNPRGSGNVMSILFFLLLLFMDNPLTVEL